MEQELVLLEEKPQPAPETVGMKRTYSRAGLSVAALYGTISASGGIAVAVICFVLAALLIVGVLPPIATERLLENPYSVLDYVRSLKGTGVIALLLLIFLLVQAAAWGIGYVIMRLILKKGTPIPKRNLSLGRFLLIVLMCFGVWGVGAVLGNLASFFGVETQEMISTEQFGWEALPFLIYAVVYYVCVVALGPERGGWNDLYKITSYVTPLVAIVVMLLLGLAVTFGIRYLFNKAAEKRHRELQLLWDDSLTDVDIRIEVYGLGRFNGLHGDISDITIPVDILRDLAEKYGLSTGDLMRAYSKGLENGLTEKGGL